MKIWESDWPTALAPMQDVTGLPFMCIIDGFGSPDLFLLNFLEYIKILSLILRF